jgi:alkanesulfonate monooxygenase SsuD/methylene tetrahydromethanopterin reductase-like flavin-dependent oxidoreductase (luciferase family)
VRVHGDTIRFGVHSGQQHGTYEQVLDLWLRAEALGFDWVSVFDHFRPPIGGPAGPCFDGPALLAALAARTTRIRCAILVSAVTWRHPAIAANIAATIDHISGGRVEFGFGAGGDDLAYRQYGIPFPAAAERLTMLDEACHVVRGLWTEPSTTFTGSHFQLVEAHLEPKPVQARLPLLLGGDGERRMLNIVARHADIWNTLAGTPEAYQRKTAALARHCDAAGRDPATIRQSVTFRAVLAETRTEAERRYDALVARVGADSPVLAEYLTVGTPEDCVRDLQPFLDLGVRDFLLGARPPVDWASVDIFAREVIPAVRR